MSLDNHIEQLRWKHADLGRQIEEMRKHAGCCSVQLTRLKKKKLRLKDEIQRLESGKEPAAATA